MASYGSVTCTCSAQPINDGTDVEEVFTSNDVLGQDGPFLFYTERNNWLPYQVDSFTSDFSTKHIWVSLYDHLCTRIFSPMNRQLAEDSPLLSAMGIGKIVPDYWDLYQEYGLVSAVPYKVAKTALHVRFKPT